MKSVWKLACTAALALFAPLAGAATAAAPVIKQDIGGRPVQFVVPDGYCTLNPDNGREREWQERLTKRNEGQNMITAAFIECGELASFRKNKDYRVRRHGHYAVTLTQGKLLLLPVDSDRVKYLAEIKPFIEKTTTPTEDALKKATGGKGGSLATKMQVRGTDTNAIFVGSDSVYESKGTRTRVEGVTALTLVKGIPVALNLVQDQGDAKQRERLYEQQKQAAARFVAANK